MYSATVGDFRRLKLMKNNIKFAVGKRWVFVYSGSRFMIELLKTCPQEEDSCKIVQVIDHIPGIFQGLMCDTTLGDPEYNQDDWEYLEGQDKP